MNSRLIIIFFLVVSSSFVSNIYPQQAGSWESFWNQNKYIKQSTVNCYKYIERQQKSLNSIAKKNNKKNIFNSKNCFCDESCKYTLLSGHIPTLDIDITKEGCYELIDILLGEEGREIRIFLSTAIDSLRSLIKEVADNVGDDIKLLDSILRTSEAYSLESFKNKDFLISNTGLVHYAITLQNVILGLVSNEYLLIPLNSLEHCIKYIVDISDFFSKTDKVEKLLLDYLIKLDSEYLPYFRIIGADISEAQFQIKNILSLLEYNTHCSFEKIWNFIALFQNERLNSSVRPFVHTEMIWIYLVSLREQSNGNNFLQLIQKSIKPYMNEKNEIVICTKMDMCDNCEHFMCKFSQNINKKIYVVSISEHTPSNSYSRMGLVDFVKKIPIDSEISGNSKKSEILKHIEMLLPFVSSHQIQEPEKSEIAISLQKVISERMMNLLNLDLIDKHLPQQTVQFIKTPSIDLVPSIFKSANTLIDLLGIHCSFFYSAFIDNKTERLAKMRLNFQQQKNDLLLSAFNKYLDVCANNGINLQEDIEKNIKDLQK